MADTVATNPDLNVICVVSIYGPDRKTAEVAARMMESLVGERFVFHASEPTKHVNPMLAYEARCIVVVREGDREEFKHGRWANFTLAKAEALSRIGESD